MSKVEPLDYLNRRALHPPKTNKTVWYYEDPNGLGFYVALKDGSTINFTVPLKNIEAYMAHIADLRAARKAATP